MVGSQLGNQCAQDFRRKSLFKCFNTFDDFFQIQLSALPFLEKYSENMQQIYRRTSMSKCDFNKKQLYWNHTLARVFKKTFSKNTSGGLLVLFQVGTFGRGSQYRKIQTITRLQTLSDEAAEAVFRSCLWK